MSKLILDHLLHIETTEDPREQAAYAEGLYMTNKKFAALCDLAYRRSMVSRYADGQEFPNYKVDNVGYGLHLSSLEKVYNKLKVSGFIEHGNNKSLPEALAQRKLIQVFESVSDVECRFIEYVLRKDIPWFDREAWKRAKHS